MRAVRIALFLLLASLWAFAAPKATILVVESYHAEYIWDISYTQALQDELGGEFHLEIFYMDTKRLPPDKHQAMADAAWKRYQELKPILVILGDDAALKFLAPRFIRTATPVVYLGINNNPRDYYDPGAATNITGVLERPLLLRTLILVKQLLPAAKRGLILFDTDRSSYAVQKESFSGRDRIEIAGIQIDLKIVGKWEVWKSTVKEASRDYDFMIIGLYQTLRDEQGRYIDPEVAVRWTTSNSPLPPFGFWDFGVGADKAIGGMILRGREQGKAAVELIRKILAGAVPSTLGPVTASTGGLLFSRKQLGKYHLVLPPELSREAEFTD